VPARTEGARTFTERARREQIVRAAVETLAGLGYADTSLGKIAKTAGLSSVGMVSYYFTGKAELMAEVVSTVLATAEELVAPRVATAVTAVEQFRAYVEGNLEWAATHRSDAVALVEIVMGTRGTSAPVDLEPAAGEVVAGLVARAQAERAAARETAGEPALDPLDPAVVAGAVRGAVNGAVGRSLRRRPVPGPDPELAGEGATLAELFVRGL
jgi:AcrR family transcriptional regulator